MEINKCGELNICRVNMIIVQKCLEGGVEFAFIFIAKFD